MSGNDIIETEAIELKVNDRRISAMPESRDIQTIDNSPAGIMQIALNKGIDIDRIEKMLELQEKWEAREAKKTYAKAMAEFKANSPEIIKTVHVEYRNNKGDLVQWDHSELGKICEDITKGLSPYGFWHKWEKRKEDGMIYIKCILTHADGHSESVEDFGPPDTSGNKDALKADASTTTYLQRHTLLAVTGLAEKGTDRDSIPDKAETITHDQINALQKIIDDKNIDTVEFFKWAKVEKIDDILSKSYDLVLKTAQKAKGRPKTKSCPEENGRDVLESKCEKCEAKKAGTCASWS
jgi:hypothetical protein